MRVGVHIGFIVCVCVCVRACVNFGFVACVCTDVCTQMSVSTSTYRHDLTLYLGSYEATVCVYCVYK